MLSLSLLRDLVRFSPSRRLTVEEALAHPYFQDIRVEEQEQREVMAKQALRVRELTRMEAPMMVRKQVSVE